MRDWREKDFWSREGTMKNDPQMTFTVSTSHFNININYDFVIFPERTMGKKLHFKPKKLKFLKKK
jgi:hypothetical protein